MSVLAKCSLDFEYGLLDFYPLHNYLIQAHSPEKYRQNYIIYFLVGN